MILWTIKPAVVYEQIIESGVYRCNPALVESKDYVKSYLWLVRQMEKRIGPAPKGVTLPVWAWYKIDGQRIKPDLRCERGSCGQDNEDYICLEIEIPDQDVVLSDFDGWCAVLNNWLISYSREEDEMQKAVYKGLSDVEKEEYKDQNWQCIFDISPMENDWFIRGYWIQATFWELKREQIRKTTYFRA